ncbi:twin-arginine translocation pathway signal protein [Alphaproteobacteria bacterium KMM 3653]|uniref:Twin-arginine translocation pathway signal protein n=1 Tax=Harenicola maris TaxID=2841044 RepID=A0AAP2G817_9RHOB|nr:twin-arginine translocation pathway signal protein [Harenicola maris]
MFTKPKGLLRATFAVATSAAIFAGTMMPAAAQSGDPIRKLTLISRAQAANPAQFQAAELIAQAWRQLGLDVDVQGMPRTQQSDAVWYNRDTWDLTMWEMAGRPERSDPDELIYNLFHSTTRDKGYNFVGYANPEYDALAEKQRMTADRDERKVMIDRMQEIINEDQVYAYLVHPLQTYAFDKTVWDPSTTVVQPGLGIKNFWTFTSIMPLGDQKDLIMNSSAELNAISPLYISGAPDSWVTELIWDRMMRIGPDGLAEPWAAETVEWSDDAKSVTITLREGMMWHDGNPVTAEDVVFSFTAPIKYAPMYKPFVDGIANIEVIDDATIKFDLAEANAAFETSTLAKVNLVPKHIWEPLLEALNEGENAESILEETRIGSGPFKFDRWATQQEVVLNANTDHWAAPKMDRWIMRIVLNAEATLGMLRSAELNFLSDYTGDPALLIEAADADGDLEIVESVDIGFQYAAFNHRRPPFDDVAFRRALSAAINRELIRKAAYSGFAVTANSSVSPALSFWHKEGIDTAMPQGMDTAKSILEEAGYVIEDGKLHYPAGVSEQFAN